MADGQLRSIAQSLRVHRFRWPLLVLLASIGLTAVAAFDAQRVVRSQRRLADRALHEFASFAAWSYAQHLLLSLNAIEHEAIGAVNHGDNLHTNPTVPTARDLAHYLPWDETCTCRRSYAGPNPQAFFAVDIRAHELNVGLNDHESADGGWDTDPMPHEMRMDMMPATGDGRASGRYTLAEQRWLLDSLTTRVRGEPAVDRGYHFVVDATPGRARFFAYTLMPTAWGDTMVYGARYSPAAFTRILTNVLDANSLLPATFTQGRRNRDVLAVIVRDSSGTVVYATDSTLTLGAHVDLPARAAGLRIDAGIRPEIAGTILIGGLPASRLPFLLGLLGLAAALSIVAVMQLRREGELAQLRGDFVSSVSHELRTPVAQIRLYLETLQLGRAESEAQRAWSLGHIERETTRLSHLVENVLRFSTLGRADPTVRERTDVGAEVTRIAAEFRPLAASRRAIVRVTCRDTPPVSLRPDALRHIVLNLLDNAVKYGPPGQTVDVVVQHDDHNVLITVADEGPGVDAADRERIWRAFTRGSAARSTGGSGIGLTIVRDVAEAHGGSASMENTARGARFVITLPTQPATVVQS